VTGVLSYQIIDFSPLTPKEHKDVRSKKTSSICINSGHAILRGLLCELNGIAVKKSEKKFFYYIQCSKRPKG
jgi:hypothetical protein